MKAKNWCLVLGFLVIFSFAVASNLIASGTPDDKGDDGPRAGMLATSDASSDTLAAAPKIAKIDYYYPPTAELMYSDIYKYNTKGQLYKVVRSDGSYSYTYKYNTKGQSIKETETYFTYNPYLVYYYTNKYNASGARTNQYEVDRYNQPWVDFGYVYDNNGTLTKRIRSYYGGGVFGYRNYFYNADGQLVKYVYMNSYNAISYYYIYQYNKSGLRIKGTRYDGTDTAVYYFTYIYQ